MRAIIVITAAVFLSACATLPNPVTPNRLGNIESAYGLALSAAVAYRNACARRAIPASCRPIVVQIQRAGRLAQQRVLALRRFVRNNPTLDASALANAAADAVQALQDVETQYGVR